MRAAVVRVADPDEAEGRHAAAHGRRVRRGPRGGRAQVPPAGQRRRRAGRGEVELDAQRLGAGVREPELELGDHAEVPAPAAQPPEQLGVLLGRGADDLAGRRDHLERHHVVAGQAVLAGQPAHPAAQGQAADPGMGDVAGRHRPARTPGWPRRARPAGHRPGPTPAAAPGRRVRRPSASGRSSARPRAPRARRRCGRRTGCRSPVPRGGPARRPRRRPGLPAAHDQRGTPVHHGVPDGAGLVVPRLARSQDLRS